LLVAQAIGLGPGPRRGLLELRRLRVGGGLFGERLAERRVERLAGTLGKCARRKQRTQKQD
jgi:hypothetical protein